METISKRAIRCSIKRLTKGKDNGIILVSAQKGGSKMLNELEVKILEAYRDGNDLGYIVESFNIPYKRIKEILIRYKEYNREKRTFTEDFKRLIAERDINGVARRQIAEELEINVNTVKKACEQFGQAFKEKSSSEQAFTQINLDKFDLKTCPNCESKNVNLVDDNTTYCKDCGAECEHYKIFEEVEVKEKGKKKKVKKEVGYYAMKVNWEYLDE